MFSSISCALALRLSDGGQAEYVYRAEACRLADHQTIAIVVYAYQGKRVMYQHDIVLKSTAYEEQESA